MIDTQRELLLLMPRRAWAHHHPHSRPAVLPRWVLSVSVLGLLGCKDLTGSQPLPSGTRDPSYFETPAGAVGMWTAAMDAVELAIPQYIVDAGLLTDELEAANTGASLAGGSSELPAAGSLDERILPEQSYGLAGTSADVDYSDLNQVRGLANQAIGALAAYDTGAAQQGDPVALRSELFAMEGYAEILLADFFCSGVPLSTLDFQKDWTYHAGSTTDSVYGDAITKLDSAYDLARSRDSAGLQDLALVLKGRAFLDLGQYDSAAAAVAEVPEGFSYMIQAKEGPGSIASGASGDNWLNQIATISNLEGQNGLPYIDSDDPRSASSTVEQVCFSCEYGPFVPLTYPTKYGAGLVGIGFFPFTVADGIEAQLIRAEAALQAGDATTWIGQLNALRSDMVSGLAPIKDPVDPDARVDTMFTERAFWLFLTGHRQGDLRRLIRVYGRNEDQVYPVGPYLAPGAGTYGNDVAAPIPGAEYANPLFQGCKNRTA